MKGARFLMLAAAIAGCHDPEYDAYDHVLEQIGPDGSASKETALAAFYLAIGPLPGVSRPPGKTRVISDGTIALDMVLGHWNELTAEQRAAVLVYFPPPSAAPARALHPEAYPGAQAEFEMLVAAAAKTIALKSARPIPFISVVVQDQQPTERADAGQVLAITRSYDAAGNLDSSEPAATCIINFYPLLWRDHRDEIDENVPHEVFHCFHARMFSSLARKNDDTNKWFKEGGAERVGLTVAGHRSVGSDGAWKVYFADPKRSLYARAYGGDGFFGELQAVGIDPWIRFEPMTVAWEDRGQDAAFLSAAGDKYFFATWAPSIVHEPTLGPDWDATGPAIPEDKAPLRRGSVGNSDLETDTIPAMGNAAYLEQISAEVVQMRVPRGSRIQGRNNSFGTAEPAGDWCTRAGGCTCPMNSDRAGDTIQSLPADAYYLAVPGAFGGAQWLMVGQSLDDYCRTNKIDPCLVGTWTVQSSTGATAAGSAICTVPSPFGALVTIEKNGTMTTDYGPSASMTCQSGTDTLVLDFSGAAPGKMFFADHGYSKGTSDLHAVMVHETLDGVDVGTQPFSKLFPDDFLSGSDTATYSCSRSTLTLTNGNGNTVTYTK